MGVPKGTDNFNAYRAAKQEGALELLRTELEKARRRKMPYPSKATLVSDMADAPRFIGRHLSAIRCTTVCCWSSSVDKPAPRHSY